MPGCARKVPNVLIAAAACCVDIRFDGGDTISNGDIGADIGSDIEFSGDNGSISNRDGGDVMSLDRSIAIATISFASLNTLGLNNSDICKIITPF